VGRVVVGGLSLVLRVLVLKPTEGEKSPEGDSSLTSLASLTSKTSETSLTSLTSALMLIRLFQQDTTCSVLACHGRRFPEAWVNFSVSLPAKRLVRNIWQLVAGLTGLSVRSAGTSVRMS